MVFISTALSFIIENNCCKNNRNMLLPAQLPGRRHRASCCATGHGAGGGQRRQTYPHGSVETSGTDLTTCRGFQRTGLGRAAPWRRDQGAGAPAARVRV
jgi:hypothetical protein